MSRAVSVPSSFLAVALAASVLSGCGAEAPLDTAQSDNSGASAKGSTANDTPAPASQDPAQVAAVSPDLQAALQREELAPGYVDEQYPEPPYGFVKGSTVPNLDFLGWYAPSDAGYDTTQVENIDLGQFYDPTGDKGIELLMVNASAVWCSVCQAEFLDLKQSGTYDTLRPRGLEMLGVLFEDRDAQPARYSDMENWARVFEVKFPFALDPGFKMGSFFDRSATPMNMVVDARTMKLLIAMTGYNTELYDWIDRELTARGR